MNTRFSFDSRRRATNLRNFVSWHQPFIQGEILNFSFERNAKSDDDTRNNFIRWIHRGANTKSRKLWNWYDHLIAALLRLMKSYLGKVNLKRNKRVRRTYIHELFFRFYKAREPWVTYTNNEKLVWPIVSIQYKSYYDIVMKKNKNKNNPLPDACITFYSHEFSTCTLWTTARYRLGIP